jgi:DNA invertase Pin-like site-specific DNA recombinase
MAIAGYGRISTHKQHLDQQLDALTTAGAERILTDTISGIRDDRPGLKEMLSWVREGDTVCVASLDRLGRSLSGIIRTIETLQARVIVIRGLREGIDTSTSSGRMVAGVLASLASYEVELIRERASAAREAALARGVRVGRPTVLTVEQLDVARKVRSSGESVRTICATFRAPPEPRSIG